MAPPLPPPEKRAASPSFFKIMVGDFKRRIRIPPSFVEKHLGGRRRFSLRGAGGKRKWEIETEVSGRDRFFGCGWDRFAAERGVSAGDFVIFFFDGKTGFRVTVFGKNGCEKVAPAPSPPVEDPAGDETSEGENLGTCFGDADATSSTGFCAIPRKLSREPGRGIESLAFREACSLKPLHPYFIATCTCVRNAVTIQTIPRALVKECGLDEKKSMTLEYPQGVSCVVTLRHRRDGRVELGAGWSSFWRGNCLWNGDVCLFEFVEGGDTIRVHVFREKPLDVGSA